MCVWFGLRGGVVGGRTTGKEKESQQAACGCEQRMIVERVGGDY